MKNFDQIFASFKDVRVGVIGDIMLDTYWWGHVERISPEAPVPIVALEQTEDRLGGAGNVAVNLAGLGAKVDIITALGMDEASGKIDELLKHYGINNEFLMFHAKRQTTRKTRIISRNQHMLRIDVELPDPLTPAYEEALMDRVIEYLDNYKPQVIIIEDYDKGVITPANIEKIVQLCKDRGVITAVDPKYRNFLEYREVDIFKPNLKEVKAALKMDDIFPDMIDMERVHSALQAAINHKISLITLSEFGIFYKEGNKDGGIAGAHVRNVADVSGAGDTVIAVASLVYAVTKDVKLMAEVANLAGGLVCEQVGTVAIEKEKLLAECQKVLV